MSFYSLPIIYHHFSLDQMDMVLEKRNQTWNSLKKINESLQIHIQSLSKFIYKFTHLWNFYSTYNSLYHFVQSDEMRNYNILMKHVIYMQDKMYFACIDIYYELDLFSYFKQNPIKTMYIGEGKGGFLYALEHVKNIKDDSFIILTDEAFEMDIQDISYSFHIYDDIYNTEYMYQKMIEMKNSQDLIIIQKDYDPKQYVKQLFKNICFAIATQCYNGMLIFKINDIYDFCIVEMLYFLSLFYHQVHIYKPKIMEQHTNMKYIICTNFLYHNSDFVRDKCIHMMRKCDTYTTPIISILKTIIPKHFVDEIITINAIYGQQQMEHMNTTIQWMDSLQKQDYNPYKKMVSKQCVKWLKEHDMIS
jgi:hypothetical protein